MPHFAWIPGAKLHKECKLRPEEVNVGVPVVLGEAVQWHGSPVICIVIIVNTWQLTAGAIGRVPLFFPSGTVPQ